MPRCRVGVRGLLGNISKNNQITGTHKNLAGFARQCVLAYAGLFSNERKKSVAESVRKTKGLSGAFWGRGLFFKKRLKIIGLGRFFRPERRPLQNLRPIIYRPARAYCQRMLSSRRAFRIATGGPNAPRHSRICATLWIGAGR